MVYPSKTKGLNTNMSKKTFNAGHKWYSYITIPRENDLDHSNWEQHCEYLRNGWWDDLVDVPYLRKLAYAIARKRGMRQEALHHTYIRNRFTLDDFKNHVRFFIRLDDGLVFVLSDIPLYWCARETGTEMVYVVDEEGELHETYASEVTGEKDLRQLESAFLEWLLGTPFMPTPFNPPIEPEQIDWVKVWALFQRDLRRRDHEGWYCSFEDSFEDALREMRGEPPLDKGSLEEQLEEAKNLWWENMRIAVSKIIQLAKKGLPEAQALAAQFHAQGIHASQDDALMAGYALASLAAGYEGVYALIAFMCATGRGVPKNPKLALKYLDKAISSDDPDSFLLLGEIFAEGRAGEANAELAGHYLREAIKYGDFDAIAALATYQRDGLIEVKEGDAELLQMGAERGYHSSMFLTGYHSLLDSAEEGAVPLTREAAQEAFEYIVRAAQAELPQATEFLEQEGRTKLLLSDGTLCRYDDFYEILEPDDEERFWPEYAMR